MATLSAPSSFTAKLSAWASGRWLSASYPPFARHTWKASDAPHTSSKVVIGEVRFAPEPTVATIDLPAPDVLVISVSVQVPMTFTALSAGIEAEVNVPSSAMNVPASEDRVAAGVPATDIRLRPQTRIVRVLPVLAEWFESVGAGQGSPALPVATTTSVTW